MYHQVALYARVSSDRQVEEGTIASQLASLHAYGEQHDYQVDADGIFIDDGYSGATLVRPGLEALRDRAMMGTLDQILVLAPDRLARNHAHQLILIEEFKRLGVDIVFVNRPIAHTPEDQLLLQSSGDAGRAWVCGRFLLGPKLIGGGADGKHDLIVIAVEVPLELEQLLPAGEGARQANRVHRRLGAGAGEARALDARDDVT